MATKGERHALAFLAGVALLGAGTRVYRSHHVAVPTADLDRQIAAVETTAARGSGRGRGSHVARRDTTLGPDESARAAIASRGKARPQAKVDLDRATLTDIERLPGIGPAFGKRIVASRDSDGAFGCLAALHAVKGVGPATLRRIDSLVVFSGTPRASCR
jgi:DNA uptake protein ComE-like DNA-binding protein